METLKFKHGLDEPLPLSTTMIFGLQWYVVVVPYIIILGMIAGSVHFANSPGLQLNYLQKLFLATGVTLFVQVLLGHKLPLVIGPAAVLLSGIVANQADTTIGAIYMSVAFCGAVLAVLSWCNLLERINVLFTNRIIGIVLVLIALTILPTIFQLIVAGAEKPFTHLVFSILLILAMLSGQRLLPDKLKSTIVIWALLIGSLLYYGLLAENWPVVATEQSPTSWEFAVTGFEFDVVTIISFMFCYLALTANDIGSIQSTASLLTVGDSGERSKRGLFVTGLGNLLAGCLGVMGPVNYSFSSGIIIATGCAARLPLAVAGLGMILLAGMPSIISLFSYIPAVVTGSLLFYTMCSQTAGGLMLLGKSIERSGFETGLIVGVSLMLGTMIAFMPTAMAATIPAVIRPLVTNGFVMGVTIALVLEHIVYFKAVR